MRPAFICRQCLSRLTPCSSSPPPQLLRSGPLAIYTRHVPQKRAIHTQLLQEQASPTWQRKESDTSYQEEQVSGIRDLDDGTSTKGVSIRKYYTRDQNPATTHLKKRILSINIEHVHSLLEHIGTVYNLSTAGAHVAAGQLKKLLRGRKGQEASLLLDEFDLWKTEYATLLRQFSSVSIGALSFSTTGWAVFSDGETPSIASMNAAWTNLDPAERERLWPRMVLSILGSNPTLLSPFVQSTYDPSWSPVYVVEDLVRTLFIRAKSLKLSNPDPLVDLVFFLLESSPHGHLSLGGDTLSTVVSMTSLDKAVDLFRLLNTTGHVLSSATMLHFASRFAKSPEHKALAAEILCSMANIKGFDINAPDAASVCTSLLNLKKGEDIPRGQAAPDELFKMLLEHGLRPNLLNISALIQNFCIRGYLDTAWTVFDLLLQYRIEPDEHVYSIILDASKKAGDVSSIRRVVAAVHSQRKWNVVILNQFLDIMFKDNEAQPERRRRQRKSNNAFRPMLQAYAKFFKLEPLQKLCSFPLDDYLIWRGLVPRDATHITDLAAALMPQPESQLMDPDTTTLTLMLAASIRKLPKGRSGPKPLIDHYRHFNRLLVAGDPLAVSLVENHGTLVYDMFLRSMLQHQQYLESGVHLVQNMLRLANDEEQLFGKNKRHPRPSAYTWTILVNGFKNHDKPRIASTMMNMMVKDGGITPDIVTWNALIKAYTRLNDARGAVRTMRYMEQAGLQPNKHTVEALESMQLSARELAITLMESSSNQPAVSVDEAKVPLAKVTTNRHAKDLSEGASTRNTMTKIRVESS